jgi:hypothetical protein
MQDDDDRPFGPMPYLQADRIRAPEPPGGFRPPRKRRAMRSLRRQREAETARLRLARIFGIGAAIIGAAAVLVAILVIVLVVQQH